MFATVVKTMRKKREGNQTNNAANLPWSSTYPVQYSTPSTSCLRGYILKRERKWKLDVPRQWQKKGRRKEGKHEGNHVKAYIEKGEKMRRKRITVNLHLESFLPLTFFLFPFSLFFWWSSFFFLLLFMYTSPPISSERQAFVPMPAQASGKFDGSFSSITNSTTVVLFCCSRSWHVKRRVNILILIN